MNNLIKVSELLSSCLTTEVLQRSIVSVQDKNLDQTAYAKTTRNQLFVQLMDHSGEVIARELNRELTSEEVLLVYNRIGQFLTARGFD